MRRKHEGSAQDEREDRIGAKALGISRKAYEKTPRDKAEDAAGDRIKVKPHSRARPMPPPPPPPPSGFGLAQPPGAEAPDEPEGEMGGL